MGSINDIMQTLKKEAHFFFFLVFCIVFNCSWRLTMFDKKQNSCVKRIHLVTNDGLYHRKTFYAVKILFIPPLANNLKHDISKTQISHTFSRGARSWQKIILPFFFFWLHIWEMLDFINHIFSFNMFSFIGCSWWNSREFSCCPCDCNKIFTSRDWE